MFAKLSVLVLLTFLLVLQQNQATELHLFGTSIKLVTPDTFKNENETIIKNVSLNFCETESIQEDSFSALTELEHLWIIGNNIIEIKNIFDKNIELKTLDVSYNKIEIITPKAFTNLKNLQSLDLSHNNLKNLNENLFQSLISLKMLNLNDNKLQILVPILFQRATNLEVLKISRNQIEGLAGNLFSNLERLQQLYIQNNKIKKIPVNLLTKLINLEVLYLSNNFLSHLDQATFEKNMKLEYLYLNNNNFTTIQPGIFNNLINIHQINLEHNQLTNIDLKPLSNNTKLEKLFMHYNLLTNVDLNGVKQLKNLTLDHNMWNCDCLMKDTLKIWKEMYYYQTSPACVKPEKLENVFWIDSESQDLVCGEL